MLDPLIYRVLTILFALLLLSAGLHKLLSWRRFNAILSAYEVLPGALLGPAAVLIPSLEVLLGGAWLFNWQISSISAATATLLTLYLAALAINLRRGRTYIDCGCGFTSGNTKVSDGDTQQLSVWLLYRNAVLIGLSLLAGAGMSTRQFLLFDYIAVALAVTATLLVYGASSQLLLNHNAIDSWRKPTLAGRHND